MPWQNGRANAKRRPRRTRFQQGRKKWKHESESGKLEECSRRRQERGETVSQERPIGLTIEIAIFLGKKKSQILAMSCESV